MTVSRAYGRGLELATRVRVAAHTAGWRPAFESLGRRARLVPPFRGSGLEAVSIGDGVYIGGSSWLRTDASRGGRPRLIIGEGCRSVGGLTISAVQEVTIGNRVSMARNVYIADHTHAYETPGVAVRDQGLKRVSPVRIADNVWLGQNVVIGPGVTIGTGAVIGAGSLVTTDVPAFSLAIGNPAVVVKTWAPTAR